jgi:hypothetical protein
MRRATASPEYRSATTEAAEWLSDYLEAKGGRALSAKIKAAGHGEQPLRRARERLALVTESEGFPRVTHWCVPFVPSVVSDTETPDTTESPWAATIAELGGKCPTCNHWICTCEAAS